MKLKFYSVAALLGLACVGVTASSAQADIYTVDVWNYPGSAAGNSTVANESNPILGTLPTYVFTYSNPTINWATSDPANTGALFIGAANLASVTWVSGNESTFMNTALSNLGDSITTMFDIRATWTSSSATTGNVTSDDGSTLIIGGNKLVNMQNEQTSHTESFASGAYNGARLDLYYVEGNGAPAVLDFNINGGNLTAPVPEISTWAMMILGFFGVGSMAYRRKSKLALRLS